ncbi:hypothetical protein O3G_MSEX008430 [Manduca sexta]|uniref:Uncharacterized protein n=1 Tax=Manduca sexta TaxID=7130 RepID=A0A921ZAR3_MANSE|nr:hypothetical protein O3G_MSEX008430 [Manduca sexta]KAG6453957.1 hypothetical protein O3G_MSEX008430 [Manduca sexta]
MESPVRICLGAALVVNLLVLSTRVSGNALPQTTQEPVRDDRITRHNRLNATTWSKTKTNTPDVSINELSPKDSISEEHTEKNAKYKDRGRVRFFSQLKSSTESTLRRVRSSTEADKLIIVTPTPEVKKPVEIIDSMKLFKKTKMPTSISSTTPMAVKKEVHSTEEFGDEEEEEENESFERFTSSKFHDNTFFTIPSFDDDDDSFSNKVKQDYSSPSYGFSSFFPKGTSYGYNDKDEDHLESGGFFDFDSDLTTPKNDFFDKKYQQISGSIIKKLESIKAMAPPSNASNIHKIAKENVGLEKLGNNTPTNKSTVFIKNTKEIRVHDNEGAGTAKRQLSDVQGTSIYYEMSVLSTETYINHTSDDDCDNDTLPSGPTASTSPEEEINAVKLTQPSTIQIPSRETVTAQTAVQQSTAAPQSTKQPMVKISTKRPILVQTSPKKAVLEPTSTTMEPTIVEVSTKPTNFVPVSTKHPFTPMSTKPTLPDLKVENITTASTNFVPISSVIPFYQTVIPVSTQNIISSTERVTKVYLNSYNRNRNYSKRLNLTGVKDSPNSVTAKPEIPTLRPLTRKFYYTTPRNRPIWMLPKRNVTKIDYVRPTSHTIYSEHFNIKDKLSTTHKPKNPNKTMLTTVSSEIDPVLQSDISGIKKVVHSQSITDNSIPTLWKRGSTKFRTSTATSAEVSDINEMELPPTSIAWSLASMLPSPVPSPVNATSTTKTVDENELQKVNEVTADKKESATVATTTTTSNTISENIITKNITEVEQNKLPWQPVNPPTSPGPAEFESTSEGKTEKLAAESNISVQSSAEPVTVTQNKSKIFTPAWIPAIETEPTTKAEAIPPVDATRSTGFESITKLPSDITTPQDETISTSKDDGVNEEKIKTTTDYEITTIRFSYLPVESVEVTDDVENETESTTQTTWHPVMPTRTRITTVKDSPITTYRPKYMTTTEMTEEISTIADTTPPVIEVSSQILGNATEKESTTTESIVQITVTETMTIPTVTEATYPPTTIEVTTQTTPDEITPSTTVDDTTPLTTTTSTTTTTTTTTTTPAPTTSIPSTTEEDTTTIVVEVVTEINTEREKRITTDRPTTENDISSEATTDCSSEENSNRNEIINQEKPTVEHTTDIQTTEKETHIPTTEKESEDLSKETTPEITTQQEIQETTTPEAVIPTQYKPIVTTPEITEVTSQKVTISVVTTVSKADTTTHKARILSTTEDAVMDLTTKPATDFEDLTTYAGEVTTEASSRVLTEESSTGAAVAIAVSTIGVIALVLLIGLLLVVRRRGRRGIYAQRCTPVSLDAYSLDSVSIGHRKGNHRLRASKRSYGNPAYDDEVSLG